jgi:hypothetical protein
MVKKCVCGFLALFFCFSLSSAFAAPSSVMTTANQIMITNHGIMVNIEGQLTTTSAVVHVGNGVYEINAEYYGSCGRCGGPLTQEGKCTNQNCNQYGPRERE